MTTFYLRLTLLPILLLTVVLLVIHAQPYDDHELRELLLSTNCPAPCFMGIQPGVTTVDEAVKLLEASGWVENIQLIKGSFYVPVGWNTHSPKWFRASGNKDLTLWIEKDVVTRIDLDTTLQRGQTQLLLGKPYIEFIQIFKDKKRPQGQYEPIHLEYFASYPDKQITVYSREYCTNEARITYNSLAGMITYYKNMKEQSPALLAENFRSSAREVLYMTC
ncbi:MAG: hypothetical protein LCI00_27135 [Chloroflexi bacterium]|nr:hypothetical protein [Chloroflexota bacterium]MCC6894131.1 hypothetical protein [Anaerolineae bacterium]